MEINAARIVLTGAAGGIGSALARELSARGAMLMLVGRNGDALSRLSDELATSGRRPVVTVADIATDAGIAAVCGAAVRAWGGTVDIIVNNAAVMEFGAFEAGGPDALRRLMATNVEAPMLLTQRFLPGMLARRRGGIVCIGSILGTLGMPFFTAYSASKFALRGFTESLRRELQGSGIEVCLVAPRSVRTALNHGAVQEMATATGMHQDDPAAVAGAIVQAMEHGRPETLLGFPEALFARLNATLPRLVDKAMTDQRRRMAPFARAGT